MRTSSLIAYSINRAKEWKQRVHTSAPLPQRDLCLHLGMLIANQCVCNVVGRTLMLNILNAFPALSAIA